MAKQVATPLFHPLCGLAFSHSICHSRRQNLPSIDVTLTLSVSIPQYLIIFLLFLFPPPLSLSILSLFFPVLCRPADEGNGLPAKRRRVTAEMEGKYIINMPKGTTARTARILAQQAKKGRASPTGQGEPRILIIQPPLIIIPLILWTAASKGNWSWNVFISYHDKDDPYP